MVIITIDNMDTSLIEMKKRYGLKKVVSDQKKSAKALSNLAAAHSEALNSYVLNIDYENDLAFDTDLIVSGGSSSAVLGIGILGTMILGTS